MNHYCNNCGKNGHSFHQCKSAIISYGIIVFRENPVKNNTREYLLIRRKDTLGFVDFMRGKYSIYNKEYILNMIKQMTNSEKHRLLNDSFSKLWEDLWGMSYPLHNNNMPLVLKSVHSSVDMNMNTETISKPLIRRSASFDKKTKGTESKGADQRLIDQYKVEEQISRNKFESLKSGIYAKSECYNLEELIRMTPPLWVEAEWGFPKGRRNYQERDYDCAVREFCEETGYIISNLVPLKNIQAFEEIFTGSNYKSYKHKYYVTYMRYEDTLSSRKLQECEVSESKWMTADECSMAIRDYNIEKKRLLLAVEKMISENHLSQIV
jgi:8-oxo-dGTP pyrophosphatase MutT (NUDIX family)